MSTFCTSRLGLCNGTLPRGLRVFAFHQQQGQQKLSLSLQRQPFHGSTSRSAVWGRRMHKEEHTQTQRNMKLRRTSLQEAQMKHQHML